jgi:hypothetical protein
MVNWDNVHSALGAGILVVKLLSDVGDLIKKYGFWPTDSRQETAALAQDANIAASVEEPPAYITAFAS